MHFNLTHFFFFFSILCFHEIKAQLPFNQLYGTYMTETGSAVWVKPDSSVYAFGTSSAQPGMSSQYYLVHLDSAGGYEWSKFYGSTGVDQGIDLYYDEDSAYIYMLGNSFINDDKGYDIKLIKADSTGNIIYEKNFGTSSWDFAAQMIRMNDGRFAICGYTFGGTFGLTDAFVLMLNNNGDSLAFRVSGDANDNYFYDLVERSNDTLVLVGPWETSTGLKQGAIAEYKISTGTFALDYYFSAYNQTFNAVALNPQGNYFIGSTNDSTAGLGLNGMTAVFNKNNHKKMIEMVFAGADDDYSKDVLYHDNAYRILTFTYSYGLGNGDGAYYEFDNGGYYVLSRSYGDIHHNELESMSLNRNNSLIFVGTSEYSFGANDLWVVNVDDAYNVTGTIGAQLDPNKVDELTSNNNLIQVYPNPSRDRLNLVGSIAINAVRLIDTKGTVVLSGLKGNSVDISSLNEGVYLMMVETEEGIFNYRIVKTN